MHNSGLRWNVDVEGDQRIISSGREGKAEAYIYYT